MHNRVKLPTKKNKQVLRCRLLQYRFLLSWLLLAGLLPAYSQVLAETVLDTVTVIGTTPLHGSLQNVQRIPSSVQTADSEALERGQALNLADHLRNNFASVTINDVVSNPYQPDVQYRGFTASPLLGLPQGLSVYVEGIRFNEPFGDTVNWDLVADGAIGSINLFSGSNPVFGQNTLGGALSLKIKDGFNYPGSQLESAVGNDGRWNMEFQHGGSSNNFGYYLIGNLYEEDGWRRKSPTEVRQGLANLSWEGEESRLGLIVAVNDNTLTGNGAVPINLMSIEGRETIYTFPDETETQLSLLGVNGDTWINPSLQVAGNVYYRSNQIDTFNGDDSDYEACSLTTGPNAGDETLCEDGDPSEAVEFLGFEGLSLERIDPSLDPDEIDGTNNISFTDQDSFGLAGQLTYLDEMDSHEYQLTFGASFDYADIHFKSRSEFAELRNDTSADDRGTEGINLFDADSEVDLDAETRNIGLFFTSTISLNESIDLTLSGRYNHTKVEMFDQLEDGPGSLDGNHTFKRFNPAIGQTIGLGNGITAYMGYAESSRAPSPAELSCADEEDPCKLPNGFVSDPPLEQVVSKTFEFGVRADQSQLQWNVGFFHTTNHDDIIFQQSGRTVSEGFFSNAGKTRRMGVELGATRQFGSINLKANYTWLEATFRDPFVSFSPNNPLGGDRQVDSGDHIPGIPEHVVKLGLDWLVNDALDLGAELSYQGSQYYRGDEANENEEIDGFALVNLRALYRINKNVELYAKVDNLFDTEYETFAVYGESEEVLGDVYPDFNDERFVGPGKPRTGMLGVRIRF